MKTDAEKLALIEKHLAQERAMSTDGMTAWDRVEAFKVKHGHLPDKSAAPCPHCFEERTQAIIRLQNIRIREKDTTTAKNLADRVVFLENAARSAINNLGVPGPDSPAPVAEARRILLYALMNEQCPPCDMGENTECVCPPE